jgi:pantetheine-phosphate adenylyltransferase
VDILEIIATAEDLHLERTLNQSLGVPTVFLPAQPELAAVSSAAVCMLGK